MFLVREVFQCKPGKAKTLVKIFKEATPLFLKEEESIKSIKIMTDAVGEYWTVVIESEVDDMGKFFRSMRTPPSNPELGKIMGGYMDCVEGGRREIYVIE